MYTEERTTNNETVAIVADATPQSNVAVAATAALNKPTLQIGSTGQAVKELQQLLYHWGYYSGPMDGIFGAQVQKAVKGYQHRVFLTEDGMVGSITWQALYSGAPVNMPILMNGSSGNAVKIVQNVLKINGYYFGAIDGYFGTMTDVAVRQFQISKNIPQDGIVGAKTWYGLSKLPH
ncbi:MAG: peptidoglycan-binding protein [Microcoleus sp. PH2017_29_MFU_D_A]|jgi:peptidoglycan hydrolase-like protein with peptidoglycan-binding domain|uniref:peptidoglycan-binding domain-containing protein n=1 Tax=unclassified Microcoleus TaxID=2642155 RepID=UPI001DC22DA0|nr:MULTISPECIES: peptidoglycan-binding protein [unclassified Microcoleus]MCC3417707.1 peptidoglycan-binding protein [Microcoleus sp. PH2017_07_MST_O_A]MCC3430612.1 peptidoglycan-binding protein [Microcoleus sp. PH2017_04_SCI_O_A]MCC3443121.1 peptidoglycan-binding protein [Microcoleus sp. PH2017_03_ELD_O_A]MCC3468118.1 peptidoglycan-binding protein [Microcoleus sp. PH2017_06_SFM_O_A]MCC3504341.1 peptidoglycan-binding protein [Microcoleus sp. PH2017_19_SFW_U_A]MCC3508258.1 peptidoglycan-binding